MIRHLAPLMVILLSGCVEEPTPKEAEKAVTDIEQDEVKAKQLSIEEAAEQATKLIEEDAKAESDAAMPAPDNN
jgi:PBP1b-binding outer membrane lipoprotein LpoB